MSITPKQPAKEWLRVFLHEGLLRSKPYHIDTLARSLKLDQNESPWDWPLALKQLILAKLLEVPWNRYPPAYDSELAGLLAQHAGVSPQNVLLCPGSNILICLLLEVLNKNRQGSLVIPQPSFPLYEQYCHYSGIPYTAWPLDHNLQYNLASLPPPSSRLSLDHRFAQ